jgi:Putative transposase
VTNVQKGDVPSRYQSLARYLAKYVMSLPISLRRIDRYDGQRVTYHYRSHKSERVAWETVDVYTFIGRMVQHVCPKGFKRVRYYGVQATKTFARLKERIQNKRHESRSYRQAWMSPSGHLQRNTCIAARCAVKRCWSMKLSLMWRSVRPNSAGSIPAECPRWDVPDATARPWRTSNQSPSPPGGR